MTDSSAPGAADGAPVGRRVVLGMLAAGAAGVVWGAPVQRLFARVTAPLVAKDGTGLLSLFPGSGGFRIYSVVGFLPQRSKADYKLAVQGLVDRPATYSFADVGGMPPTRLTRDFQCVTGWRVDDVKWVGVKLSVLLDAAGVQPGARAVTFGSFDGVYTESLTLEQARRDDVLVVYEMQGEPITAAHGGPVRLLVAPMYGYKSLKWLDRIEVVDRVEPGYWERRGYDVDGWVGDSNGRDDAPT